MVDVVVVVCVVVGLGRRRIGIENVLWQAPDNQISDLLELTTSKLINQQL